MWDLHIMSWASLKVIYWGSQRCVQAVISDHLIISLYNTVLQWRSYLWSQIYNTQAETRTFSVACFGDCVSYSHFSAVTSHPHSLGSLEQSFPLVVYISSKQTPKYGFSTIFHQIKKKTPLTYSLQENKPGHYQYRMPVELSQSSIPG